MPVRRDYGRAVLEQQSEDAFTAKNESPKIGRPPNIWIGARCEKHFADREIFAVGRDEKRRVLIKIRNLIDFCARIYQSSNDVRVVIAACIVKRRPRKTASILEDVRAPG